MRKTNNSISNSRRRNRNRDNSRSSNNSNSNINSSSNSCNNNSDNNVKKSTRRWMVIIRNSLLINKCFPNKICICRIQNGIGIFSMINDRGKCGVFLVFWECIIVTHNLSLFIYVCFISGANWRRLAGSVLHWIQDCYTRKHVLNASHL